jgi:hypothetical protein
MNTTESGNADVERQAFEAWMDLARNGRWCKDLITDELCMKASLGQYGNTVVHAQFEAFKAGRASVYHNPLGQAERKVIEAAKALATEAKRYYIVTTLGSTDEDVEACKHRLEDAIKVVDSLPSSPSIAEQRELEQAVIEAAMDWRCTPYWTSNDVLRSAVDALTAKEAKEESQWTTDRPTVAGFYWVRWRQEDGTVVKVDVVHLRQDGKSLSCCVGLFIMAPPPIFEWYPIPVTPPDEPKAAPAQDDDITSRTGMETGKYFP